MNKDHHRVAAKRKQVKYSYEFIRQALGPCRIGQEMKPSPKFSILIPHERPIAQLQRILPREWVGNLKKLP